MVRTQFKNVKIGGIFTNPEGNQFFRKINKQEARIVFRGIDGKMRVSRQVDTIWWLQDSSLVYFHSWNEHNENVKYSKPQTATQRDQRKAWMTLGSIARTKKNLLDIGNTQASRLNLPQLKTLEAARMTLGWIDKQIRHELAANKAAKKLNNRSKVA